MPIDRSRDRSRPGEFARSRWSRLRARIDRTGDGGFTMVEMIVALIIIGIVMTALGSFFVATVSATARQGSSQAAVQLADDAVEQARALQGVSVVNGRDCSSSATQWGAPVTGVASYENGMTMACDSAAANDAGATAALPTSGKTVTVNKLNYTQNWYVGNCWQVIGGGACGLVANAPSPANDPTSAYASFYRVVVAVTWSDSVCASSKCVFIAATLISNAQYEPLFNSGQSAAAPTPVNPGDQTSDSGVPMNPLKMTSTGGAGTIIWSATGLPTPATGPTAVSITPGGVISGTPTTPGTYSVTVTATDSFGLANSAKFTWTIVLPPTLSLATQTSTVNVAASYTPSNPGGTGPLTWSITNLPSGINYVASTGVMSGKPDTIGTTTVSVTVTDAQNQPSTSSFAWTVNPPPLAITTPPTQTSALNAPITNLSVANLPVTASGGYGTYTWSASNLPTGMRLNSDGTFVGTPTASKTNVTITATDATSKLTVTTSSFTWNIINAVSIVPPANQNNAVGDSVSLTIATTNAQGNVTWNTPTLPHGLHFTPGTGASTSATITGVPDTAGTTTVTLTATDNLVTDTKTFTWTVMSLTLSGTGVSNGNISSSTNTTANITLTVNGGTAPYTWSVAPTSGSLPGNVGPVTQNPTTTEKLSGALGASSYNKVIRVTVTDKTGAVVQFSFNWKVS